MLTRLGSVLCVLSLLVTLSGCGGGSDNDGPPITPPPTSGNPPPPPPPPPAPVVGAAGGTVTETSGAAVIVPPGAIATDTTIRIAMDSTGAPPVPATMGATGSIYMVTPHGGEFTEPVEVRIPAPTVTLQPNQALKIAKAEPGGPWVVLDDTELADGQLVTKVQSFSWFMTVIVSYPLPILQAVPFAVTTTLDCGNEPCIDAVGDVTATYTVVGNNGQVREGCDGVVIDDRTSTYAGSGQSTGIPMARSGATIIRQLPASVGIYHFAVALTCNGYLSRVDDSYQSIYWKRGLSYPTMAVERAPERIDVVEGLQAKISVVMAGAISYQPGFPIPPTDTNRAIVEWQRSADSGASWQPIGRSYQNEADPIPISTSIPWKYWSISHGFTATASDDGALIRAHACYTPPAPTAAPPCVTSRPTRINVLQRSALPAIVDQPRSVLIRSGQTANFSASASGLPAPTLQWQSRPANAAGDWTNVSVGTGGTTANYTTAAQLPSNNGQQYRVIATNALGNAASSYATVSVSDIDVAPSITTQPASLGVTSGNDAVFAVAARGTEALSYQWRFNGANLPGANSPVLRLSGVTSANAGSYSVAVSNSAGSATSNTVALTVSAGAPVAVAPSIVTQPASVTAVIGTTATLAIGVDGTGPFSFQWRRDGVNVAGATSAVLTFPAVSLLNAGSFSVVVTNSAGSVTSASAALDVTASTALTAPSITSQPSTLIVPFRGSGVLAVGATGSGPLSYQWSKDGAELPGATLPVLDFRIVADVDVGRYTVAISNSMGSVVSNAADIILLGAPVITQQPVDVTASEGANATFFVAASSSGLRYQWSLNGDPIPGAIGNTLNVGPLVQANSNGVYSVLVYNGAGFVQSAPAVLRVTTLGPVTLLQSPADVSIHAGETASICMAFGGAPPFSVQMNRWQGTEWTPVGVRHNFYDNLEHCIATPVLQLADNGAQFLFLASNEDGGIVEAMTRIVTVTVTAPAIQGTTLASRATSGATANNRSYLPSLSADGNIVAFMSDATNLVPGFGGYPLASNNAYVRNLSTGVTTLVNQTPAGTQSQSPYGVNGLKLAAGGRYVIFSSLAGDLVADDDNGSQDVFVRDLQAGITTRVSLKADGSQITNAGNGQSDMQLNISADGRFVSFVSGHDLIGNDPSGTYSLYLRSLQTGHLQRVFSSTTSLVAYSALSDDGEHMAYLYATFDPGATRNIIVHYDAEANVSTEAFSIDSTNNASFIGQGIGISGNGRYIVFALRSPTALNGSNFTQILALDSVNPDHITVASGDSNGFGNGHSSWPEVSDDGHVLFMTNAGNLTGNFANGARTALVVRDLNGSQLPVASRRPDGTSIAIPFAEAYHAISRDGTAIAFVADELDMTGGTHENQVYVAPRP